MAFVDSYEIEGKPWGRETVLAHTSLYTLKRLVYEAGHQGGIQYHERKDEAFHLHEGKARVTWLEDGILHSVTMLPGQTFHVPPLLPHKFEAITRCIVFEASNPVFDDRVNVAEQMSDPDGLPR